MPYADKAKETFLISFSRNAPLANITSTNNEGNIINEIQDYFVETMKLSLQYCIWQVNSGINLHNDHLHDVGATIYLNETWDASNGGIFLWKDNDSDIYKGLVPKQNTMIINNQNQQHLVTSINHYPNKFRYTIQIWGKEND